MTPKGIESLRSRLPHLDFASFERDPSVANVGKLFTVDALVRFVERKLAAK